MPNRSLIRAVLVCGLAMVLRGLPVNAAENRTVSSDGYQLVWSDEFDHDGPLDPKAWSFESGFVRNHELQLYQRENAFCRGGVLIIEARRERRPNPAYAAGSTRWQTSREFAEYTSACLTTRGKHEWTYGRFELRARIDSHEGSWPAFWTLGTGGRWPADGEIDIMEYYKGTLLFNVAWAHVAVPRPAWNTVRKPLAAFPANWSDAFHVWRMDWDASSIRLYLDDVLMNSQDISKPLPDAAADHNPFHAPVYLLINQAIGGDAGGDPSGTKFPVRYEVDYVRVYQKPPAAAEPRVPSK